MIRIKNRTTKLRTFLDFSLSEFFLVGKLAQKKHHQTETFQTSNSVRAGKNLGFLEKVFRFFYISVPE